MYGMSPLQTVTIRLIVCRFNTFCRISKSYLCSFSGILRQPPIMFFNTALGEYTYTEKKIQASFKILSTIRNIYTNQVLYTKNTTFINEEED